MSETGAVKQSEVFPKAGYKPAQNKKIRDTLLLESDWYKEGVTIWIRPSGIQRLGIAEEDMSLAQKFTTMAVVRPAPNKSFIMCSEQGGDGNMKAVKIPLRLQKLLTKGKEMRVEVVTDAAGGVSYQHEDLTVR